MFRKQVKQKKTDRIRWRGQEVTRIEAFSDAAFAFALTLLIASLEVPHKFEEVIDNMRFTLPFGICFGIVFMIWHHQNMFFRRFGLHDKKTLALNAALIFVVLDYMFPLKFLFGSIFASNKFHMATAEQSSTIFCLYCGGFACFYLLFALMYFNAYAQREKIGLTAIESFCTISHAYNFLSVCAVSILAVIVAAVSGEYATLSGMVYILMWPVSSILRSKREKLFTQRFGDVPHVPVKDYMHAHTAGHEVES
jgi:uncharacterized membrane protein